MPTPTDSASLPAVAVLGLGHMGAELAHRLLRAGHPVRVWNRSPDKAAELARAGAVAATSPADAAAGAEIAFVSLSGDDAVRAVLLSDGAAVLPTGPTVVDTSTVAPATTRELAAAYAGRFAAMPIAGAPLAVREGRALLLLAAPAPLPERLDPVLAAISTNRLLVGARPEAAAVVKVLNNYLLFAGLAALADVVATGQAAGLGDAELARVLDQLPVIAPGVRPRVPALLGHQHPAAFTIALGRKDLRLAADLSREFGERLGLLPAVQQRYERAGALGLDDLDVSANIEVLRRLDETADGTAAEM